MQDLISSEQKTMTLKEITDLLDVRHDVALKKVKKMAESEGFGMMFDLSISIGPNKQTIKTLQLNKRQSIAAASILNTTMLMKVIDRWMELEEEKQFKIPQTLPEALQLAADQAKQLEEQAPKIEVYERLADRKDCMSTTEAAKSMGVSSQKLNKWLKVNGYKFMHRDLPTVKKPEWFNVVDGVNEHSGKEYQQCLITPKGQIEIAKRYNK